MARPAPHRRRELHTPGQLAPGHEMRRETVLIVDDDKLAALRLGRHLDALGYAVRVATSLGEALRAFDDEVVDLVLMDAVMPRIDGFRLTKILRRRMTHYVPVLFVSSLSDKASRARGIEAGADDMLSKPVDPLELRLRLQAMLRIRALARTMNEQARALQHLAEMDALTGVPNRRRLDICLRQEWARARRHDRTLALLMLDLDHFKSVNDIHGHGVGDEFLRFFGGLLRARIRESDSVFRYGGEEFVVLLPETSLVEAIALAERLREQVQRHSSSATPAGLQTVSIGVSAQGLVGVETAEELLTTADVALYAAKASGRNGWRAYGLLG